MPLITTTRCERSWPRRYTTYYQETEAPYRRAELATVYRIGTRGLVIGRWTSRADGEHQALTDALSARPAAVLGSDGQLLHYRRTTPEASACSADETPPTPT
ncbi:MULTISPECIES: hypothetical protein [unclassified Streptomyces]|uniref:hypothetical protein n=1 Tax=unclassified Streptomyces TaxID=2593676 RepID=UPI002E18E679|nr:MULTISPECIES: hypothetical protein [unclassified Streptomyces]